MYALQDYIGEDSVGKALGRIVDRFGLRLDTFALASDLVDEFYRVTPDSLKYLVDDLFAKITLYENRMNSASWKQLPDSTFLVSLDITTLKFYADSVGNQTGAPLNDYIYVALMDEKGEAIYYEKHLFTQFDTIVQIIAKNKPAQAGTDPYLVLIDREKDDNICEVKEGK